MFGPFDSGGGMFSGVWQESSSEGGGSEDADKGSRKKQGEDSKEEEEAEQGGGEAGKEEAPKRKRKPVWRRGESKTEELMRMEDRTQRGMIIVGGTGSSDSASRMAGTATSTAASAAKPKKKRRKTVGKKAAAKKKEKESSGSKHVEIEYSAEDGSMQRLKVERAHVSQVDETQLLDASSHRKNAYKPGKCCFFCHDEGRAFWAYPLKNVKRVTAQHWCATEEKIVTRTIGIQSTRCNRAHRRGVPCVTVVGNARPPPSAVPMSQRMLSLQSQASGSGGTGGSSSTSSSTGRKRKRADMEMDEEEEEDDDHESEDDDDEDEGDGECEIGLLMNERYGSRVRELVRRGEQSEQQQEPEGEGEGDGDCDSGSHIGQLVCDAMRMQLVVMRQAVDVKDEEAAMTTCTELVRRCSDVSASSSSTCACIWQWLRCQLLESVRVCALFVMAALHTHNSNHDEALRLHSKLAGSLQLTTVRPRCACRGPLLDTVLRSQRLLSTQWRMELIAQLATPKEADTAIVRGTPPLLPPLIPEAPSLFGAASMDAQTEYVRDDLAGYSDTTLSSTSTPTQLEQCASLTDFLQQLRLLDLRCLFEAEAVELRDLCAVAIYIAEPSLLSLVAGAPATFPFPFPSAVPHSDLESLRNSFLVPVCVRSAFSDHRASICSCTNWTSLLTVLALSDVVSTPKCYSLTDLRQQLTKVSNEQQATLEGKAISIFDKCVV